MLGSLLRQPWTSILVEIIAELIAAAHSCYRASASKGDFSSEICLGLLRWLTAYRECADGMSTLPTFVSMIYSMLRSRRPVAVPGG